MVGLHRPGRCIAAHLGVSRRSYAKCLRPPGRTHLPHAVEQEEVRRRLTNGKTGACLPFPKSVVDDITTRVKQNRTMLQIDALLVFVCGADSGGGKTSARDTFMKYASVWLPQYRFFKAEEVFAGLKATFKGDLLSLEGQLAEFADCILMLLESPGTVAELGAFTYNDDLARIVLAVNDKAYRSTSSFITDGPIAKLNEISMFKPVVYCDLTHGRVSTALPEIEERLREMERKNRMTIRFPDLKSFVECLGKDKMLFLRDMIAIFSPVKHSELLHLLSSIYGPGEYGIEIEIALLRATGLVEEEDGFLLSSTAERGRFVDFGGLDPAVLRSAVFNHYHKRDNARLDVLKRRAGIRT